MNSASAVFGRTEPRLYTRPLRDLSAFEASWGHDFIGFCELIGFPLDEWQEWLAIHLGELLDDGSPRYRKAIILVARQNGKSMFAMLLTLYWMFVERVPLVFGVHKDRAEAKKAWKEVMYLAENDEYLGEFLPNPHQILVTGEEDFWNSFNSHYMFSAPNGKAARGKTVYRALIDELREHKDRKCWSSLVPATNAVADPLVVCITNEGDLSAVVLHEEYDAAYDAMDDPDADVFLAAWSSPPGSDPLNPEHLAYANPSMNRVRANGTGLRLSALLGEAHTAMQAGGTSLAAFKTEMMCMRVDQLDAAIDGESWDACALDESDYVDLADYRRKVALCYDVNIDGTHITLVAAATLEGITYAEVVKVWEGFGCTKLFRQELPELVAKIGPRMVGWFPIGPSATVAAELKERPGRSPWPPRAIQGGRKVEVVEIKATDTPAVCMGLAEQVLANEIAHPDDAVINSHISHTQKLNKGDQWVFARRGDHPIDATYALAGAVHLARTMPAAPPALRVAR